MSVEAHVSLKLIVQRALLGNVTPEIRAVSVDIDPDQKKVYLRFVVDANPSDLTRELASSVGGEIISDYASDWRIEEEIAICPFPQPMSHLRYPVFACFEEASD